MPSEIASKIEAQARFLKELKNKGVLLQALREIFVMCEYCGGGQASELVTTVKEVAGKAIDAVKPEP